MEWYSRQYLKGIANYYICNCVFNLWTHVLWHNPNAIANRAFVFPFSFPCSLCNMSAKFKMETQNPFAIALPTSYKLWFCHFGKAHICYFSFSASSNTHKIQMKSQSLLRLQSAVNQSWGWGLLRVRKCATPTAGGKRNIFILMRIKENINNAIFF